MDAPYVRSRELFISDAIDTYPVTALRGRACCLPFGDIKTNILEYISKPNNWFYILGYNPESRRMANAKGEIRVGVSHQAITPVCNPDPHSEEAVADFASMQPMETLLWKPTLPKSKLMVYLRAGKRSNKCRGVTEISDPTKVTKRQRNVVKFEAMSKQYRSSFEAIMKLTQDSVPTCGKE